MQLEVPRSQGLIDYSLANTVCLNGSFLSRHDGIATVAAFAVGGTLIGEDVATAIETTAAQPTHSEVGQPTHHTSISGETVVSDAFIGGLAGLAVYGALAAIALKRLGRETYQRLRA